MVAVSPQQVTIGALLTHIRKGHMVSGALASPWCRRGDRSGRSWHARIVASGWQKRIDEIDLPSSTSIGGIVRGEEVIIAHDNVVIQNNDHVILFVADQKQISRVERLFSVDAVFL